MHIVVFGVGAIGGFYAAKLIQHYQNDNALRISLLARGKTYEVLKEKGLTLFENQSAIVIPELEVYSDYSEVSIQEQELTVVLLCTKSKDTIAATENIRSHLTSNTVVVSIQNGVENEIKIGNILGNSKVIGALTNIAAVNLEPAVVEQNGDYGLILGELDCSKSERIEKLYKIMRAAKINVRISCNITVDLWSKLVWNAAFNPLSVLYQATTGELLANPSWRLQLTGIMQEVYHLAKSQGIDLPINTVTEHIQRTDKPEWYAFRTSMLQDFQKAKPIELEDILGVVIRKADQLGIAVPYSKEVYNELVLRCM
jgi:2-dehydropantoate 2-reductase